MIAQDDGGASMRRRCSGHGAGGARTVHDEGEPPSERGSDLRTLPTTSDGLVTTHPPWWQSGVLYQIYPLSFCDSDADGYGDLQGIIDRLDHLEWLGVTGIWLSPITVSPNADWGYDVADYCAVQPGLGTMETFDHLVAQADARGIRVLLDIVPNHTSDQHPWFVDSRSSLSAAKRDWYVWAEPGPDGAPRTIG